MDAMAQEKVAVVTGANRGLGLELAAGLCARLPRGVVYLTARDDERGRAAQGVLQARGLRPRYHVLDIADEDSVRRLADHLRETHGGLDLLVNNAGLLTNNTNSYEESAAVIDVNYRSLLLVERHLFPLLRRGARVLHVSSDCGHLSNLRHPGWLKRLASDDLTDQDIEEFVQWHLDAVRSGTFRAEDFADGGKVAAYRVSKIAVSALARLQAARLAARGVAVNSLHPGLVRTDMTRGAGFLSPAEAARAPLRLLLDAPLAQTGSYVWFDGETRDWRDSALDLYYRSSTLETYK